MGTQVMRAWARRNRSYGKGRGHGRVNRQDLATDSQWRPGERKREDRDANLSPGLQDTDADALGGIFALGEGSLSDYEIHSHTRIMSLKIKVLN